MPQFTFWPAPKIYDDNRVEITAGCKVAICGDPDPKFHVTIPNTLVIYNPEPDCISDGPDDPEWATALEGRYCEDGKRINIWIYHQGNGTYVTENVEVVKD